MSGEIGEQYIGNVRFSGVEIKRSERKTTEEGSINCVWTDAGYFEFKDQPLWVQDGLARVHSQVQKVTFSDSKDEECLLSILRLTEGKFKFDPEINYVGVSHLGDTDRDYSSFTIDAGDGKKEYISTSHSNVNIVSDEEDVVTRTNYAWGIQKDNVYIEHTPIDTDAIKYKE
ncbi:hypothetical protein IJD34_00300 [bacterium]|nr:hypothetical protein [bacterium]